MHLRVSPRSRDSTHFFWSAFQALDTAQSRLRQTDWPRPPLSSTRHLVSVQIELESSVRNSTALPLHHSDSDSEVDTRSTSNPLKLQSDIVAEIQQNSIIWTYFGLTTTCRRLITFQFFFSRDSTNGLEMWAGGPRRICPGYSWEQSWLSSPARSQDSC